ncbi:hypothetical protein [Butyrivibrio sp.]|uniref:hypothetical protein n=1 Tax=Butyrivibrio sp. TaxID=28121 RepID=UPI0025C480A6|nr:hypothetical protein [Butyrivibrio sp.]MBQ7428377.1 hypothetical protein [Butyrivibrio sp.]MBQ9303309.1 hypothetical protein [Butyrivibrio sp.]
MIEINYMVLEDIFTDMAKSTELLEFQQALQYYIRTDKKLQRVLYPTGYGRIWQDDLLEDPKKIKAQLGHDIDKAFTKLVILRKVYKEKTRARLFDGSIGVSRKECSQSEWESFRPEKADLLDQIVSYLIANQAAKAE